VGSAESNPAALQTARTERLDGAASGSESRRSASERARSKTRWRRCPGESSDQNPAGSRHRRCQLGRPYPGAGIQDTRPDTRGEPRRLGQGRAAQQVG
jgi:hypothetical protein